MLIVTANQLVAHAIGDYLLQSDWMALKKRESVFVACVHALTYSLPFFCLTDASALAMVFVFWTHAAIDHFGIARHVVYAKNFIAPKWILRDHDTMRYDGHPRAPTQMLRNYPWAECDGTGYHKDRPPWLAVWLTIIADNTLHVLCNAAAIQWL